MESIPWAGLLNEAAKSSSEGWTAATYMAEAEAVELKVASTGKNMVVIKFRFIGGLVDGKKLTRNFVIVPDNPAALSMFFRQMAALGAPKEFFAAGPAPEAVAAKIVGHRVNAKVKMGRFQGETRPEIDMITALPGAGVPASSPGLGAPGSFPVPQPQPQPPPPPPPQPQPAADGPPSWPDGI